MKLNRNMTNLQTKLLYRHLLKIAAFCNKRTKWTRKLNKLNRNMTKLQSETVSCKTPVSSPSRLCFSSFRKDVLLCLISWVRHLNLITLWFESHVKLVVPCWSDNKPDCTLKLQTPSKRVGDHPRSVTVHTCPRTRTKPVRQYTQRESCSAQ